MKFTDLIKDVLRLICCIALDVFLIVLGALAIRNNDTFAVCWGMACVVGWSILLGV